MQGMAPPLAIDRLYFRVSTSLGLGRISSGETSPRRVVFSFPWFYSFVSAHSITPLLYYISLLYVLDSRARCAVIGTP